MSLHVVSTKKKLLDNIESRHTSIMVPNFTNVSIFENKNKHLSNSPTHKIKQIIRNKVITKREHLAQRLKTTQNMKIKYKTRALLEQMKKRSPSALSQNECAYPGYIDTIHSTQRKFKKSLD